MARLRPILALGLRRRSGVYRQLNELPKQDPRGAVKRFRARCRAVIDEDQLDLGQPIVGARAGRVTPGWAEARKLR